MTVSESFARYAFAFEKAYNSDEWGEVEACFCENAVYEVHGSSVFAGRWQGAVAIVEHFKAILDRIDRRCDRRVELLSFEDHENSITIVYRASYELSGDRLVFEGKEEAVFRGDLIESLVDHFNPTAVQAIEHFASKHAL